MLIRKKFLFAWRTTKSGTTNRDLPPNIRRKGIGDVVTGIMVFIFGLLGFLLALLVYSIVSRTRR